MSALTNGIKRITIRVPATLHKALAHAAIDRNASLNRLAVEALEQYLATIQKEGGWFPLRELSDLLTPAAEARGLTEEDLMQQYGKPDGASGKSNIARWWMPFREEALDDQTESVSRHRSVQ